MKKLIIALFFFTSHLIAQVDSALAWYPLHNGNVWQYWYHYKNSVSQDSTYVTVKVLGDTILPNGKTYKIVDGPTLGIRTCYQRVDSLTANVYSYRSDSEILTDSLRAKDGDNWGSMYEFRCGPVDTVTIFNFNTIDKTFYCHTSLGPKNITLSLALGLGIIKSQIAEDDPNWPVTVTYTHDLVYAKIDGKEYGVLTDVKESKAALPINYSLFQNYPNPFNPRTTIKFALSKPGNVSLNIFDILGRGIATLVSRYLFAGTYSVQWDANKFPSGIYFYKLQTDLFSETKKLALLK